MASIKVKLVWIQCILYLVVGVITVLVDVTTFLFLLKLTPPLMAAVSSSVISTIVSFVLSFKLVFSSSGRSLFSQVFRFLILLGIGICLNTVSFWLMSTYTVLLPFWSKVFSIVLGTIWNFWTRRVFVFSTGIPPWVQKTMNKYFQTKWLYFVE